MKKTIFLLGFILLFLTNLSYAADRGIQTDKEVGNQAQRVTPLEEAGKLTGVVVRVDRAGGALEIRTSDGGISRLKVNPDAKEDLKKIKPGDRIVATLSIQATSISPESKG